MLNISVTAGGASVASLEAKPKAARGVPVSRVFELTGIESGDEERKKGFAERSRVKRSFTRRKRASRGYMVPYLCCRHS